MERRSSNRQMTSQSGYALILMIVGLMGLGGAVIAGFTQGAKQDTEHQRYLHNQRVLQEAKQALLQYAYNYPQLGPGQNDGPGRLLCPDIDNDGEEDFEVGCIDTTSGAPMIGRFPWKDERLNFYEAKDASGETLWYAVSNNFTRGLGSNINSDTNGTITIEDRSGAMLYDGSIAGVAAVIIAPGPAIDRNGVAQDRAADSNAAANYLDLFGTVDNADFVNDSNNGFVIGPIFNPVDGTLVVNDQMIIVTAAEVTAMAEKATLQAYRAAINDYLDNVSCTGEAPVGSGATEAICVTNGGVWNPVYPWLYNYRDVSSIAELSSFYPAFADFDDERDPDPDPNPNTGYLDNYGRIPSIFAEYFTETDSQAIASQLSGSLTLIDPLTTDTFTLTQLICDKSCTTGGLRTFKRDPDPDVEGPALNIQVAQIVTGVRFIDIPDDLGRRDGRITATFPALESIPFDLYFWGDHDSPTTDWTACPGGADELSDCVFSTGSDRSILHVQGTIDFSAGEVFFDFDYNSPPTIVREPATAASHATISATYPAVAIVSFPGVFSSVTYEYDGHWHVDDETIKDGDHDDEDYSTGTVDMTGFSLASLTLGMRYFPELPSWALQNGWHNSIRMAYADISLPSLAGACVPDPDGDNTNDCLFLPDEQGARRDIASLLVIAGEHDWVDDNTDAPVIVGLEDELRDVFDDGNENNNRSFSTARGNDQILIIATEP